MIRCSLSPRDIAQRLGGTAAPGRVYAPAPGHDPSDRSLVIKTTGDGITFSVYSSGDWRTIADWLRAKLDLPAFSSSPPQADISTDPDRDRIRDIERQQEAARARSRARYAGVVWRQSSPIPGTLAHRYLEARGLIIPHGHGGLADSLAFHPDCSWHGQRGPCLIARFSPLSTLATIRDADCVLRIQLRRDGAWHDGKEMIGTPWAERAITQAVKLGAPGPDLKICEGLETAIAILARAGPPVWSLYCAAAIAALPVLANIERLTIFADHDHTGTGAHAARTCARRWRDAGRAVAVRMPRQVGTDFADIWRETT